jgi:hypothetical protein
VDQLIAISGVDGESTYHSDAKAQALFHLARIEAFLARGGGGPQQSKDAETLAHRAHLLHKIQQALDSED